MSRGHAERAELARLLAGELTGGVRRAVVAHLFRCLRCEARLLEMLPERPRGTAPAYRGLVRRVWKGARAEMEGRKTQVQDERAAAEELWRTLAPRSAGERQAAVEAEPRYATFGLFELMLERAREVIFEAPREAEERLSLALAVARRLDPDRHGPGAVEAALARVWAFLANARRVLGDFRGAEEAFEAAEEHLFRSWLDPLDEALVLELKALLRRGQRRFAEAFELIDEALALYREINEPHLQGRSLIVKGLTFQYAGDPAAAVECLRRGLFLVDPQKEPRLTVVAHHNLIHCLTDGGRHAEAAALITEARPLWARLGRRLDLVRLAWMEAKVAHGLGRTAEAERLLLEVKGELASAGLAYDVALVSLDLAALYARAGRVAESKRLAAELLPIFRSREVHREALAALIAFQRAAQMEQLSLSFIEEIYRYLEQARGNPELRFRDGRTR
jgi:tetratricopeptide (TPR) repeat protein